MTYTIKDHPAYPAFKAYDVRGRVPQELTPELYYRLGIAYAQVLEPKRVAVGYDIRLSSPQLAQSLINGLNASGVEVIDIGLCGTEEIYFATGKLKLDGGLMVTASHNPADYNGLKMVGPQARPLSNEQNLAIKELALGQEELSKVEKKGIASKLNIHSIFAEYVLSMIDINSIPPLKVVANVGNGGADVVLRALKDRLPIELITINGEPDGTFPNGVPNPLLPERREDTSKAVIEHKAQLGVAWDGDFDRCFFFDENGKFVEGYYVVALLARRFLQRYPQATIVHDPRLTWNTLEIVANSGGKSVQSPTGHVFIKRSMRESEAVYGGEMSAHHYFRDFFYCDSGILPWLFVMELLGLTKQSLSSLVGEMIVRYPISGEINRRVAEPLSAIVKRLRQACQERYGSPLHEDDTDGISLEYEKFRFNLRASNTEPLVRLNVETRSDKKLLEDITQILLAQIAGQR